MYRYSSSSNQFVYHSAEPMTDDQIARHAPSILAAEPHESRGPRYAYISTHEVLQALRNEGFGVHEVRQTKVRDQNRREYTKHLVRLRHASTIGRAEVPEVLIVNSHDGTSSYQILDGIFRFICSNGLISGDIANCIRIRHSGKVVQDVIEGSFRVLDSAKQTVDRLDVYKGIRLERPEQIALANAAMQLRWDEAPIDAAQAIQPRRMADRSSDLWTTFNVIQENLLKGGVPGQSANGRRMTTRAVQGVTENVRLNSALFRLADEMARLKAGEEALA